MSMDSGRAASAVKSEIVESAPLAVVYHGEELGRSLVAALSKQGLRTLHLTTAASGLSVLERPSYIFLFTEGELDDLGKEHFSEALETAARVDARLILILDNVTEKWEEWARTQAEKVGWQVRIVEVTGTLTEEEIKESAPKLVRLAFAARQGGGKLVVSGSRPKRVVAKKDVSAQEVWDRLNQWEKSRGSWWRRKLDRFGRKTIVAFVAVVMLVIALVGPVVVVGWYSVWGMGELIHTKDGLLAGDFIGAKDNANRARGDLETAMTVMQWVAPEWGLLGQRQAADRYYDWLLLADRGGALVEHVASVAPKALALGQSLWAGSDATDGMLEKSQEVSLGLTDVETDLGLVQSQLASTQLPTGLLSLAGYPAEKINKYEQELPMIRELLAAGRRVLTILPETIGLSGQSTTGALPGRRTYLIVFQNSTELRPTGGFIGSYAIVNFDSGKLLDYKVNDIYSADGQLVGRIAPPDEILHFLGQPAWYMRDANWAADWELTAQRLEWFLQKETGQSVDGVIGVSLPAMEKLLTATGPLNLPDLGDTVDANSFYQKAEYAAEINFFPGSTQKRDYLGAVTAAMLDKLTGGGGSNLLGLSQAMSQALADKDVMFYFNAPEVQKVMKDNAWAGSLDANGCGPATVNCLAVVEANLGANKANYFVKRGLQVRSVIDKGGGSDVTVTVNLRNDSPSTSWPGGVYKDYIRFLVPTGSQVESMDLGDGRVATMSPVLTAAVLAAVPTDQFLVFQNPELTGDQAGTGGRWTAYGTLIELPIQTAQTITFRYKPQYRMSLIRQNVDYNLVVLKQPGTGADPLDLILDYPNFLTPTESSSLASDQRVIYNTDLATDKVFDIKFKRE